MTLPVLFEACFFLLLLCGLLVFVRRGRSWAGLLRPPRPVSRRLRVIESVALDPKRRVILLEAHGREIVLLTGGTSDLLLSHATAAATPGEFTSVLAEQTRCGA